MRKLSEKRYNGEKLNRQQSRVVPGTSGRTNFGVYPELSGGSPPPNPSANLVRQRNVAIDPLSLREPVSFAAHGLMGGFLMRF